MNRNIIESVNYLKSLNTTLPLASTQYKTLSSYAIILQVAGNLFRKIDKEDIRSNLHSSEFSSILTLAEICESNLDELAEPVIEHKHNGRSSSAEDVRQGAVKESSHSLILDDLHGTVNGTRIFDCGSAARFHHQAAAHSIERVRNQTGNSRGDLSYNESLPNSGTETHREAHGLERVEPAEEGCTVHDDAQNRGGEALRQRVA